MRRSSVYYELKWTVLCKPFGQHFFEPIAAFNNETVAIAYAHTCRKVNRKNTYRVCERKGNSWLQIGEDI